MTPRNQLLAGARRMPLPHRSWQHSSNGAEKRRLAGGGPAGRATLHSTPLLAAARLAWLSGWRLLLLLGALLAGCVLLHHLLPNAWAHARVVAHARMVHPRHAALLILLLLWLLRLLLSGGWQRGHGHRQNGAKDAIVHVDSPNGTLRSCFIPSPAGAQREAGVVD